MPANKNALIRYKTIDNCLRNHYRRWTLDDLVDACSNALYDKDWEWVPSRRKPEENPKEKTRRQTPSAVPTGKQDFCTIARCGKKAENLLFLVHANQQLTFCKFIVKTSYIIVSQCFTKYITCRWNCFCLIDEWQL